MDRSDVKGNVSQSLCPNNTEMDVTVMDIIYFRKCSSIDQFVIGMKPHAEHAQVITGGIQKGHMESE